MRPDGRINHVSIIIDKKLSNLRAAAQKPYIFKVHHQLRQVNEKAYEPQILAIGPYHRGKDSVQVMEKHKLHFLKLFLERRKESSVERYVLRLKELEEKVRNCYEETVSLGVDEFVEMMLLDGCFIIELFLKYAMEELRDRYDPIFNLGWIHSCLVCDLTLFENQLPFFVLNDLFNMAKVPNLQYNLTDIALHFIGISPRGLCDSSNEIKHLLGLRYNAMIPSFAEVEGTRDVDIKENIPYIHCAKELQEAGVKLKKVKRGNIFDIKFMKGEMEIPPLKLEDNTESILRNLIAYEQYDQGNHLNYFTDYVTIMDCLINSSKDVELLRHKGIIENYLGDDEVVSTMFNKLRDFVIIPKSNFYYDEIFNNVNKHCRKRRNVWMAKLRHNYFNSLWALISFLAAVLLLVLTFVQTIFSSPIF